MCQILVVDNTFTLSSLVSTWYFACLSNFIVSLYIFSPDSHETDLIVYAGASCFSLKNKLLC